MTVANKPRERTAPRPLSKQRLRMWIRLLRAARGFPIVTLDYDRLMTDAPARLGRLVRDLQSVDPSPGLAAPSADDIASALRTELQHHAPTRAAFAESFASDRRVAGSSSTARPRLANHRTAFATATSGR